jgi:protein TonB
VAALPAAAPEAPDQPAAVPAASEDALPPPPPPAMPTFRLSAGLEALSEQRPRRAGPAGLSRGPVARDTGCGGAFAYPEAARRLGAQGSVLLRIAVGADGVPISAEVVQGSGFPVLDRAARQAALRCRFDPALDGGRPVAGVAPWRVTYRVTP